VLSELPGDIVVSVGDDTLAAVKLAMAALVLLLVVPLARLTRAKAQRLPPGKPAPWTGRYETKVPAHAVVDRGGTLPPPQASGEGATWRLKQARSSSAWLVVLFVVALLGAVGYGQLEGTPSQQLISTGPGPRSAPVPVPPPPVGHLHRVGSRAGTLSPRRGQHRRPPPTRRWAPAASRHRR
jgi:hypothetical protein